MNNMKIRKTLAVNMMKYYQLDEILGVSEATRCRMLREELPEAEQDRICKLIEEHAETGGAEDE